MKKNVVEIKFHQQNNVKILTEYLLEKSNFKTQVILSTLYYVLRKQIIQHFEFMLSKCVFSISIFCLENVGKNMD